MDHFLLLRPLLRRTVRVPGAEQTGLGHQAWNSFYPAMAKELTSKQMASGAWHSLYDEYGTAQSLLVLAVPNRYLPIYQR